MEHTITSNIPKRMKVTFVKCRLIFEGAAFVVIICGIMNIFEQCFKYISLNSEQKDQLFVK
jgi:hypothetical protein